MIQNCKLAGTQVNPVEYLRQAEGVVRGDPRFVMSRTELMRFAANPAEWIQFKDEDDSTPALDFGSYVDALVLDPTRISERFAFRPADYWNEKTGERKPWNGNATSCKEWVSDHQGKIIITPDQCASAQAAIDAMAKDSRICLLISAAGLDPAKAPQFQVRVTGEWADREAAIVVPLQCLIDIVPSRDGPYGNSLADFKTSREIDPRLWRKLVHAHDYEAQGWFNLELWNRATGENRQEFRHVILKNQPPFTPARRMLTAENLEVGRLKIVNALRLYCRCLKSSIWPSFEELAELYAPLETVIDGWLTTSPADWMISQMQEHQWITNESTPTP